ncbi:acylphosphatase [Cellulomonas algicola]|uniref:acylphosphatase n=1 Tax=Cellulomonas algicola TaxID=2071633 RepID=A0A401V207_9CELL|nr:acylphosphatase [Cellulomonas algicola]GCD20913.1 acylphosphatase [Cellulomonas algicola]
MAHVARRVVVHGVVQGVGYRWSAAREAARLGVAGWVRNRSDGAVEAVVEGDAEAVHEFVGWARQGPRGASVTSVDVTDEAPGHRVSFEIEP